MAYEWVEILEPESKRKMYANVKTGDCLWEAPAGVPVKESHKDQWWELVDAGTSRSYYYNATNQATVWERPASGDIVPLAKLQQMQERLASEEQEHTAGPDSGVNESSKAASAVSSTTSSPPTETKSVRASEKLTDYSDNLGVHKKGIIFKKKVSLANMLAWSKDSIPSPMLLTLKKSHRKDATDLFKLVQMAMGDRNSKGRSFIQVTVTIVVKAWSVPQLRDELFLQLCKQTTSNPSSKSLELGWEILAIAVNFFPPSNRFFSYLEGYIYRHTDENASQKVQDYAEHCLKKLDKVRTTGAKRGVSSPTKEEVELAQKNIFNPSLFGSLLEDVMDIQSKKKPGLEIPWVVIALAEAILEKGGAETEGIFRVPGDIDAVNMLKVSLDKFVLTENYKEPHVPASALKLWFRELQEPLISSDFYESCINACDSAEMAIAALDLLPTVNRTLLTYILRFLQVIGQEHNQKLTKMNHDNLAMVWAPNFLRCPSDDPMVIFNNTKKEMQFVRHLVINLDTSSVAHLGLKFS